MTASSEFDPSTISLKSAIDLLWNIGIILFHQTSDTEESVSAISARGDSLIDDIYSSNQPTENKTMTSTFPSEDRLNRVLLNTNYHLKDDIRIRVTQPYTTDEDVKFILQIVYVIIYPTIICIGIFVNIFSIKLLSRKKLKKYHISSYIKFLSIVDLCSLLLSIPAGYAEQACTFSTYVAAFYHTHLGWNLVFMLRNISFFTILWMSYDRLLAIWFNKKFMDVQKTRITIFRLTVTCFWVMMSYVPIMYWGEVVNISNDLAPAARSRRDIWVGHPGYNSKPDTVLYKVYEVYFAIFLQILPAVVLLGLSVGLIIGLIKTHKPLEKKNLNAHMIKRKKRQYFSTVALLLINLTYVLCSVPYLILMIDHVTPPSECYGTAEKEIWIGSMNSLMVVWSAFNVTFFIFLNKDYMKEAKSVVTSGMRPNRESFRSNRSSTRTSRVSIDLSPASKAKRQSLSSNNSRRPSPTFPTSPDFALGMKCKKESVTFAPTTKTLITFAYVDDATYIV